MKFDEKQKVPLIKLVKSLIEGMNLVQVSKCSEKQHLGGDIKSGLIQSCISVFVSCIRTLPHISLLQAKKFIESAPVVLKENLDKEEAEKMKKELTDLGAEVVLE